MQDEWAIQQTLNRYTLGATLGDFDMILETFLEDGVWAVPALGMQFEGRPNIRAAMEGFLAQLAYFAQINTPAVISIDGDAATASSVIRECGKYAGRDEGMEVLGVYEDALTRTRDGWRFARRSFRGLGAHRFALSAVTRPL